MQSLILTLHIIVCVLLVILILLQSGKEGMGVIFGGGNTSVFGSTGAGGILVKLTTFMALVFVITSLSYTYVTSSHETKESAILDVQIEDVKPSEPKPTDPIAPVQETKPTPIQDSKETDTKKQEVAPSTQTEQKVEKTKDTPTESKGETPAQTK